MKFVLGRCVLFMCVGVLVSTTPPRLINSNVSVSTPEEDCSASKTPINNKTKAALLEIRSVRNQNVTLRNATSFNASLSCAHRPCLETFSFAVNSEKSGCYCDSSCQIFHDCCCDYPSVCNKTTHIDGFPRNAWSCVDMYGSTYWMRTNCSESWSNYKIASRCINAPLEIDSVTYQDFFPVIGADNFTYRNQHCATCNFQNRFEFWILNVSLDFQPVGITTTAELIDFLLQLYGDSVHEFVIPDKRMPRRYCPKLVSSCPLGYAREVFFQACNDSGNVGLVFGGDAFYKNKYCVLCHGKNSSKCATSENYSKKIEITDFYLTINFKHKSRSTGFSQNFACRSKIYDHHLKACVNPSDIVLPVDAPLDRYKVAVWLKWPYSEFSLPNMTHFRKVLTDVKPSNIFNGKLTKLNTNHMYMLQFDVDLTLNQSIELLKDDSTVEQDSATAYSIIKFLKPFTRPFLLLLRSKIVRVFKTTSRQLGCVGLEVYNATEYSKIGSGGKIYVHKTKRFYTRDQYFQDNSTYGMIKVCDKQLPSGCKGFYQEYKRNEFEVEANLSLYHTVQRVHYRFGEYALNNNTVYICHELPKDGNVVREFLTLVGLFLSVFCLFVVLVTYLMFSQLRTAPGKNIMNLSVVLLLLDGVWLASPYAVSYPSLCKATATAMHYFMLLAHISMAKTAHDTLCMFTDPLSHQLKNAGRQLKMFMVLWTFPLVFVALCAVLGHFQILHVEYTKKCWISGQHVFIIVYTPVCLAVVYNIICFTRSILAMRKLQRNGQMLRAQKQEKSSVFIYIKISTLLGLGWTSTFIAVLFPVFSYVFVVLTTFQGVYIFLAFVCKKNVWMLYRNLCGSTESSGSRSE